MRGKLENKNFAAKAPVHIVAMELNREKELLEQIQKGKTYFERPWIKNYEKNEFNYFV